MAGCSGCTATPWTRQPHDNYGPVIWGGTGERWDLLQLEEGGPPTGGEQLRQRVREILQGDQHQAPEPLAAELLERYGLPFEWEATRRRILVGRWMWCPSTGKTVCRRRWVGRW